MVVACTTLLGSGCAQSGSKQTQSVLLEKATSTKPLESVTVYERPSGMVCDSENVICVVESFVNQKIGPDLSLKGSGIQLENSYRWELVGPGGQAIVDGTLIPNAEEVGQRGKFSIYKEMSIPKGYTAGTFRIYGRAVKDKAPIHALTIPVRFN